jgi:6-pyruvoyltetrahydropterin/6-carboxytetrahydropterin synthase
VYTVAVKMPLRAEHFLIGGDWGAENERHAHDYVVELRLQGPELDGHGYLVDIVQVEAELERVRAYFGDRLLNELPEFAGLNPSVEHFSRIVCQRLDERLAAARLSRVRVTLWESDSAWAAYERDR